jgi:hypothetical protein
MNRPKRTTYVRHHSNIENSSYLPWCSANIIIVPSYLASYYQSFKFRVVSHPVTLTISPVQLAESRPILFRQPFRLVKAGFNCADNEKMGVREIIPGPRGIAFSPAYRVPRSYNTTMQNSMIAISNTFRRIIAQWSDSLKSADPMYYIRCDTQTFEMPATSVPRHYSSFTTVTSLDFNLLL